MQLPNVPSAEKFQAIEKTLESERLRKYIAVAGEDKAKLFRFYVWNCALSEAFYLPLQFAEIVCRNAIHRALLDRIGERWFEHATFLNLLGGRYRSELESCLNEEKTQHGNAVTGHHVCSALSFGFWEHLTTKRFARMLWKWNIRHNFPQAPLNATLEDLHALIETVRRWRNRIAHHRTIFDKSPSRKLQDVLRLTRWVCEDTADWIGMINQVQAVINERPN